jgi:predicted 3-demethylubiquinone-9 3-methyltransferase (glyoxalase superfamily)
MQKVIPFLWFDKDAEEAMNYYVEVFKGTPSKDSDDSEVINIQRYPEGYSEGPMANMQGKVLTGVFKLAGQKIMCLDGGPIFKFSEAISLYVECADQTEIDYFWEKLSLDPSGGQCGWTKDKFGLSWQIIPQNMAELLKNKEAVDAMLKMKKIDIKSLEEASKNG